MKKLTLSIKKDDTKTDFNFEYEEGYELEVMNLLIPDSSKIGYKDKNGKVFCELKSVTFNVTSETKKS